MRHRLAPASTLAPFIYTQMVWTTTLGFLVFGDVPHRWTIVGGLIVISSGLYLLHREARARQAGAVHAGCLSVGGGAKFRRQNGSHRGTSMATAKDRAPAPAGSGLNDDIGEEKRLELYRSQVRLREAEQRAYDLFLQNLVKGTSHLSLGQEAIAAGFADAMQKGDLTSAPIAATPTRWRAACRSRRCWAS